MEPIDLSKPGDGRRTPRRIYNGAALILAGFVLMYIPYYVTGEEWPQFGAIGRVLSSLPIAMGYATVGLGIAHIILGCIDYARVPRS